MRVTISPIYFFKKKKNREGKSNINVRIRVNKRKNEFVTGIFVFQEFWNAEIITIRSRRLFLFVSWPNTMQSNWFQHVKYFMYLFPEYFETNLSKTLWGKNEVNCAKTYLPSFIVNEIIFTNLTVSNRHRLISTRRYSNYNDFKELFCLLVDTSDKCCFSIYNQFFVMIN